MEKIITFLKERNRNLSRFAALNSAEITKILTGNFESLDEFYITREGILDIIKQIEAMIERQLGRGGDYQIAPQSIKKLVSSLLRERDELVSQILNQDLEILECIDKAKDAIIQELRSLKKSRKVIGAYKSGSPEPMIDEEV